MTLVSAMLRNIALEDAEEITLARISAGWRATVTLRGSETFYIGDDADMVNALVKALNHALAARPIVAPKPAKPAPEPAIDEDDLV